MFIALGGWAEEIGNVLSPNYGYLNKEVMA